MTCERSSRDGKISASAVSTVPEQRLPFVLGLITMLAARRWRPLRAVLTPGVVVLNAVSIVLDGPSAAMHRRWPHSLVLVAGRPSTDYHSSSA
jgi:hypothetical protein